MSDCVDSIGNCTGPSDDGRPAQCVGPWVEEKHTYVRRYVDATWGVRNKFLDRGQGSAFVDMFAGPGRARIRDTGKFVEGSTFIGLNAARAPFTEVIACELQSVNVDALAARTATHASRITIRHGDCNALASKIAALIPKLGYNIALLDPYAISALAFDTIRTLAQVARLDLVINFPTLDIKRNFQKNFNQTANHVDRFLGTKAWRSKVRGAHDAHELLDVFSDQLKSLGYVGQEVHAIEVKNNQNGLLYHLISASKHPLGHKIWKSVTKTTATGQRGLF